MKLLESRFYTIKKHFDYLKNDILLKVQNIDYLIENKEIIVKNNGVVSFGCIIYCTISRIAYFIENNYSKWPAFMSGYFVLSNSENEEIRIICEKADCLNEFVGITNIKSLSSEELEFLLDINEQAINKYFNLIIDHNNQFIIDNDLFMNNMTQLGNVHDINAKAICDFCNEALRRNVNVIDIKSFDDLEKLYKEIYPDM